jgi:hypothetical protein
LTMADMRQAMEKVFLHSVEQSCNFS